MREARVAVWMRNVLLAALAVATLAGNVGRLAAWIENVERLRVSWAGRDYRSSGDYIDGSRWMVERYVTPGADVYLTHEGTRGFQSVDRSRHLALSWAMCPRPVRFGAADGIGNAVAVLGSAYGPGPDFALAGLDAAEFRRVDERGGMALWLRRDWMPDSSASGRTHAPPALKEALGVIWVLGIAAAGFCLAGTTGGAAALLLCSLGMAVPPLTGARPSLLFMVALSALCIGIVWWKRALFAEPRQAAPPAQNKVIRICWLVCCLLLAGWMSWLALAHTFMSPTGLGVYGGKAKLLYVAGGIPGGFFTDPAFSSYQPAYPPGLALLTLGAYGIAGGCGEWLMQLLPVFTTAALLFWLGEREATSWALPWILAFFLSKQTLLLATLYYADPFVALFVLLGWERLRGGRDDRAGWALAGAAGLFKNEGLVFLLALWLVLRVSRGSRAASWRGLMLGAALPVLWHVSCRLAGAQLYDYAPVWQPDVGRILTALGQMFKLGFAEPWRYGFVYPMAGCAALAALISRLRGRRRGFRLSPPTGAAIAFAALCWMAYAVIYGLSTAADFGWHLRSSLPRLLWTPAILLLYEGIDTIPGLIKKKERRKRRAIRRSCPGSNLVRHCPR